MFDKGHIFLVLHFLGFCSGMGQGGDGGQVGGGGTTGRN